MHVMTRRVGEALTIAGVIKVIVLGGSKNKSRLGIIIPEGLTMQREEESSENTNEPIMPTRVNELE